MSKCFNSFWEEIPIDLTLSQGESENKFVFELIDLTSDRKLKIKIQEKIDLTAKPNADTDVISVHSEEEQERKRRRTRFTERRNTELFEENAAGNTIPIPFL